MLHLDDIKGWMRRRMGRRRFNPYVAGPPVFDRRLLFGRGELTERTLRLLEERSVSLTGERRIGKTSFLHHLQGALAEVRRGARRSFPVFVDLEGVTAQGFFGALIECAIEELAPSRRTLGALRRGGARRGYDAFDFDHDLQRLLADLRERTPEPIRLVFLVDEVDALRPAAQAAFHDCIAPLLGCGGSEIRAVLAGVSGCGLVPELVLPRLTLDEAQALVTRPVAGAFRYEACAVDRILQMACGRPYVVQRLCLHAVNRMLDEGRTTIRLDDVDSVAELERALPCVQYE